MDYKLAVGGLEFFDPETSGWLPRPPFPRTRSPAEVLRSTLDAAAVALLRAGVEVVRYVNPALQIRGLLEKAPRCPAQPLLLVCGPRERSRVVLVAWEPRREVYVLARARPVVAILRRVAEEGDGPAPLEVGLFIVETELGECRSAEEVADLARAHLAWFASPLFGE